MKLGTYANLIFGTKDIDTSIIFYERLGWRKLGHDVITDGCINVHFKLNHKPSPTLAYSGSDIPAIRELFNSDKRKKKGNASGNANFKSPNGMSIQLTENESPVPMPDGTPTTRTPISQFGFMGELTIPAQHLPSATGFWAKLGFEPVHVAQIPYHYAILSDGLMIIGLHEHPSQKIALTYFDPNMNEKIPQFQADGLKLNILNSDDNGNPQNATFASPEGVVFYLFTGSI